MSDFKMFDVSECSTESEVHQVIERDLMAVKSSYSGVSLIIEHTKDEEPYIQEFKPNGEGSSVLNAKRLFDNIPLVSAINRNLRLIMDVTSSYEVVEI